MQAVLFTAAHKNTIDLFNESLIMKHRQRGHNIVGRQQVSITINQNQYKEDAIEEPDFINPWFMPDKRGMDVKKVAVWRNALAHQVLAEMAADWTARLRKAEAEGKYKGKTLVAPETIIFNLCFRPSTFTQVIAAQMKDRYNQLRRKNQNAKKYIDGIKG
jgi:hypothetical protein